MTTPTDNSPSAKKPKVAAMLAQTARRGWWRAPMLWVVLGLAALIVLGIYLWQARQTAALAPVYITEPASRGNLLLTVVANGTLQPTRAVNIGSELSGTVRRVMVDINDHVKKGQVLLELDTSKLSDQVTRSRAMMVVAKTKVLQTEATVQEADANLSRFEAVATLSGGKVPAKTELDASRATLKRAITDWGAAKAGQVESEATLSTDQTNLSKAQIRSPIDGVVLTRSVDPGNAVAASLQAVTLFTLAEDLTQLRLEVNVDEADVGSVMAGQKADFTVSAYPGRKYPTFVTRIAFGSVITENVVTYITDLDVDNSDLSLRPGMSASAVIRAVERQGVLLVPNAALRFTPVLAGEGATKKGGIVSRLIPRGPPRAARKPAVSTGGAAQRELWVLKDGTPMALTVTTGISDGRMTEITAGPLQSGMQVITDQTSGAPP